MDLKHSKMTATEMAHHGAFGNACGRDSTLAADNEEEPVGEEELRVNMASKTR